MKRTSYPSRAFLASGLLVLGALVAFLWRTRERSGQDATLAGARADVDLVDRSPVLMTARREVLAVEGGAGELRISDRNLRLCFESADVRDCIVASLSGVPLEKAWNLLCRGNFSMPERGTILECALLAMAAKDALFALDELYSSCPGLSETLLLEGALRSIAKSQPGWLAEFEETITAEYLFGLRSVVGVQGASFFLQGGDPYFRALLLNGAFGAFGGTPDQHHRAALQVAVGPNPAGPPLDLFEGILDSTFLEEGNDMGAFLVSFALSARVEGRESADRLVVVLKRVLEDERFKEQAAMQLLKYFDETPPRWMGSEDWAVIRKLASSLVRR